MCVQDFDSKTLNELEQLGLVSMEEDGTYTIVCRDKEWLESNGIFQYGDFPLAPIAKLNNGTMSSHDYMCTFTESKSRFGADISKKDYDSLLDMDYNEGCMGLKHLLKTVEHLKIVEPVSESINLVMCEVYVRLKERFPNKLDTWYKRETVFYFGGMPKYQ